MTDHVAAVQVAAVDRALATGDPAVARRHLALVAALDPLRGAPGTDDPLATGAAALLAVRATATATAPDAGRPPAPPAPESPDSPATDTGSTVDLAADGAAIAHRRRDVPIDRLVDRADLATAAIRAALARR